MVLAYNRQKDHSLIHKGWLLIAKLLTIGNGMKLKQI